MKPIRCCIPPTDRSVLRAVLLLLMLGFVYTGCNFGYDALANGQWFKLAVATFLLLLAVGLRFMWPWARTLSVVMLWFFIVILQFAMFPFFSLGAIDAALEGRMPSAMERAMDVYPLMGAALFLIHILGKYKAEFVKHQAGVDPELP